jgi:serine protease AprX
MGLSESGTGRRGWSWRATAGLTTASLAMMVLTPVTAAAQTIQTVDVIITVDEEQFAATEARLNGLGEVTDALHAFHSYTVELPINQLRAVERLPGVRSVTEDGSLVLPEDARNGGPGKKGSSGLDHEQAYSDPAAPADLGHIADVINADKLWRQGITGQGVGIALIDSGVVPVAGLTSGNVRNGPDLSFESQSSDLVYLDTYGHGTHMAGIIAGRDTVARNSRGGFAAKDLRGAHVGIAPDADLISLKLATAEGATDVSQVMAALDWVVQHRDDEGMNIRVINLSFGTDGAQGYRLDPLAYAAEVAWRHGIVVVVSAGNDGTELGRLANPAINPFVLAVGAVDTAGTATTADDTVPDFSSRGDGRRDPDLVAPGRSVLSLRSPGSAIAVDNPQPEVPERFLKGSGTSQSAAVVSGAVALLLQQRPELTPDQVKHLLTSTATPIAAPRNAAGSGVLNVHRAASARLPVVGAAQQHEPGTGTGSLEASRGTMHIGDPDDLLAGENTILGPFDATAWATDSLAGQTWSEGTWIGQEWTGDCWCADSWTGRTWRGRTWRDDTWAGRTWRSDLWEGHAWGEDGWYGRTWRATDWTG